jgi:hypothetical protein
VSAEGRLDRELLRKKQWRFCVLAVMITRDSDVFAVEGRESRSVLDILHRIFGLNSGSLESRIEASRRFRACFGSALTLRSRQVALGSISTSTNFLTYALPGRMKAISIFICL